MPELLPGPIFILGVHRSGTTLLRYMLNSSPRLYIPPESDFIPRFFGREPTETLTPERTARILRVIFTRYRFVREWQGDPPDPDAFWRAMPAPTPAGFQRFAFRKSRTRDNSRSLGHGLARE